MFTLVGVISASGYSSRLKIRSLPYVDNRIIATNLHKVALHGGVFGLVYVSHGCLQKLNLSEEDAKLVVDHLGGHLGQISEALAIMQSRNRPIHGPFMHSRLALCLSLALTLSLLLFALFHCVAAEAVNDVIRGVAKPMLAALIADPAFFAEQAPLAQPKLDKDDAVSRKKFRDTALLIFRALEAKPSGVELLELAQRNKVSASSRFEVAKFLQAVNLLGERWLPATDNNITGERVVTWHSPSQQHAFKQLNAGFMLERAINSS